MLEKLRSFSSYWNASWISVGGSSAVDTDPYRARAYFLWAERSIEQPWDDGPGCDRAFTINAAPCWIRTRAKVVYFSRIVVWGSSFVGGTRHFGRFGTVRTVRTYHFSRIIVRIFVIYLWMTYG